MGRCHSAISSVQGIRSFGSEVTPEQEDDGLPCRVGETEEDPPNQDRSEGQKAKKPWRDEAEKHKRDIQPYEKVEKAGITAPVSNVTPLNQAQIAGVQREADLANRDESLVTQKETKSYQQVADTAGRQKCQNPLAGKRNIGHDTEGADMFLEVFGFGRHDPVILSTDAKDGSGFSPCPQLCEEAIASRPW